MTNIFDVLINIITMFVNFCNSLWNWFTNDITIGNFTFTPLDSLPIIGITFIVMWLIKTFIPLT